MKAGVRVRLVSGKNNVGEKKMYIGQHFFGQHEGHLRDQANDIAKESGAWHFNYTDPCTGLKRGSFVTCTLDGAHGKEIEQNVMRKVLAIGGFKALRLEDRDADRERHLSTEQPIKRPKSAPEAIRR
jgi:hypothetical protein